jgi:hypothetical protein
MWRSAVLTALTATIFGGVENAAAQRIPRADYFFVHDKGFTAGSEPNRDRSRLHVMQFVVRNGAAEAVRIVKTYRTQYGLRDEAKRREGDRNTPVGVYQITDLRRYRPDRYTGPWFFLLDYPNRHDRSANRTGGAIGIHGGPNRPTLGCIRLRDRERGGRGITAINELRKYVEDGTPVLSVPYLPPWLQGQPGVQLNRAAAQFYAHMLTTPLPNQKVVQLVRDYTAGSTSYQTERGEDTPQTDLVTVSSELNPFGEMTYRAYNLLDGDPRTCWSEGGEGDGRGEWVQVRFPEARVVRRIMMVNGYAKGARWRQNNRVKRASVRLSDGTSFQWDLSDTDQWQEFVLPAAITTRFVEITIEAVYRGDRRDWNDTSISELAVDATAPGAAGTAGSITVASASSVLQGGSAASGYHAFNAIDGDNRTAWSEGADGVGVGEWLRTAFTRPRTISAIRLVNGYDKVDGQNDRWRQNPRVRTATLSFSDGSSMRWNLRDTRDQQELVLPRSVTTSYMQFTIEAAYPGAEWDDTSISEIEFIGSESDINQGTEVPSNTDALISVSASSVLSDGDYATSNLIDGDPSTCWSENVSDAEGQWVRFEFPSDRKVGSIRLVNGYAKVVGSHDRWVQNARIKAAVLRFSDGTERQVQLRDTREWQSVDFGGDVTTRWVELRIQSTYPGNRWQDVSLSEVLFGDPASQNAAALPDADASGAILPPVEGLSVSATSTHVDGDPAKYSAVNVLDGDTETCWSEGVSGDGIGERLRFELPAARAIQRIDIVSGYAKGDLYQRNSRPKRLGVMLSDGSVHHWDLRDTAEWQSFTLPQPATVFFFELIVEEAYSGSSWSDCSISEVRVR